FPLFTDVFLNANFPEDELGKLKQRTLAGLRQQRSSPNFLAGERFAQVMYGKHPASVVVPDEKTIQAMTPAMLIKWKQERWAPQNAILAIAGDVKPAEVAAKIAKAFADWKKTDLHEVLPPNPKPAGEEKIYIVDRPGSVQTVMTLGN